jgi:signal transduction histidine kinase
VVKYRNIPLRLKLISIQLITGMILILFSSAYFVLNDIRLIKNYKISNLTSVAKAIGMNSASALVFNDKKAAQNTLSYFSIQDDVLNAGIYFPNGTEFATYTRPGESRYHFSSILTEEANKFENGFLLIYSPVKDESATLGILCVRVELSKMNRIILNIIYVAGIVILIGLGIALALSSLLQKSISGPILELFEVMKKVIKTGDYSIRIPRSLEGNDEIGILTSTSNKLLEQVEEAKTNLEIHIKDLDNFAHIVSHDLKAPLRGISGLAHFIAEDYYDKIGEEGKAQLEILKSKVSKMNNLIDAILLYSREGRKKEEKTEVDVGKLIREITEILFLPEKVKITIVNSLPILFTTQISIQQVFMNLISNAVKYGDKPETEIRIGVSEHSSAFYKFYVSDNGPGIEEKYFIKIFQLFQTLGPSENPENTGVGLAIVKKIVENHGGEIWVESTPGNGATFYFTWPKS